MGTRGRCLRGKCLTMNLNEMKRYGTDDVVDAVVIGTGAGGAPLLARLAVAGQSVVALEAGRNWDPGTEFPTDEVAARELYWLGDRISGGSTPTAFGANNSGTGVGGSTLHWGAYVPRPDPRDLRVHTEFGVGEDWPIAYEELQPYFEEVERFIGSVGTSALPMEGGSAISTAARAAQRAGAGDAARISDAWAKDE